MNLKKQFSVVLVEDNPGDARLMSEYLKESSDTSIKLKVIVTLNATIEYLSSNKADAILLDLSLPDSQGLETLNKINERFQNIPIIVLTGYDDKENAINALKYGAQDYLTKNQINSEIIARTIRYSIERKHSEQNLIESEEKYKALYDNVPLAYQSLNSEGCIIDVNPMWLKTMGFERNEVIGKWFGSFLHEDNVDIFKTNFSILKKRGSASNVHFKLKKKNGDSIYISLEGVVATNSDGTFRQTYCTFKDITEQKKREEELKESEENYRMLFESINDAVFISELSYDGKSSKFIQVNDVACQRYGYTKEELLTLSSFDINSEESKKNIPSIINTLLENKHVIVEAEHKIKDGRDIPVEISSRISQLKDKTIIHSLVRDITERKATEKLLKENEEKYRLITEKITDVVWIMDLTGKSLFVSKSVNYFSGYTVEEYLAQTISERFTRESAVIAMDTFKNEVTFYMNSKVPPENYSKLVELDYKCKDGSIKTGELLITPYLDENNKCIGLHGVTRDITERKKAEKALRLSAEEWKKTFDASPDAISLIDDNNKIIRINKAMADLTKKEETEIINHPCWKLVHNTNQHIPECPIAKARISKKRETLELLQGESWFEVIVDPVLDKDGNINNYVHIIRDVTERKKHESLLKFHSEVLQNVAEGVYLIRSIDGIIVYANNSFNNMFGYDSGELIGKHVSIVNAPDIDKTPEEISQDIIDQLSQKGFWKGIIKNIRKDGSIFWCSANVSVFHHEQYGDVWIAVHEDITKQKKAEDELKKSERQLSSAMEIAKLGYWEYNTDEDVFTFNDQFYNVFHSTAEQEGGYKMTSVQYTKRFVHPDDFSVVSRAIQKSIENTNPFYHHQLEHRVIFANGETGYISVNIFVIKDDSGHTIKTYGANQDITERKWTEELIKLSEEKFRSIFENIQDVYYETTLEGIILEASPSIFNISKYTREELIGRYIVDFYEDKDIRKKLTKSFEEKGFVDDFEISLLDKEGIVQRCSVTSKVLFDKHNRPYKIVGAMRIIEARKKAEDELKALLNTLDSRVKERTADLLSQEELYQTTVNSLTDWVFVIDNLSNIIFINQFLKDFFQNNGISTDDVIGKNLKDVFVFLNENNNRIYEKIFKDHSTEITYDEYHLFGKKYYTQTKISPIVSDNKVIRIVTTIHDYTTIKLAEEEVRKNLEKEIELNKLKSQFISTVSHEFRTPLAGILSSVQLLEQFNDKIDGEKKSKIFKNIFNSIKQSTNLLEEVMIIDKGDNKKIIINPAMIDLEELLFTIIEENKLAFGTDLRVITDFELKKSEYFFDKDAIRHIIGNIMSNALKYNGNSKKIHFNVTDNKDEIEFSVTDFGIGIPEADKKRLFEPFHRAANVINKQGTGLGLSIVKRYVDLCQGKIEINSEQGKGTKIIVRLPYAKAKK